jgi:hypothetical protein
MPFNRYIIEAKLALGALHPEEFPAVAMDALEAGFDGPVTRRTAILVMPSGWEVDQLKESLMAEWGLHEIEKGVACARLAQELAREILREGKDPLLSTRAFERLWIDSGYSRNIQELGTLVDDAYIMGDEKAAREMVRQCIVDFAEQPDMP